MKQIRIFILVLLAVLLPIRGAVAASMLCPEGVGTNAAAAVSEHGHYDMHVGHGVHTDYSASQHLHSDGDATDESSGDGHPAACHFCAAGCCMASIVGTFPLIVQPDVTVSIAFPALSEPVPAFHSGGQDRPPRTI